MDSKEIVKNLIKKIKNLGIHINDEQEKAIFRDAEEDVKYGEENVYFGMLSVIGSGDMNYTSNIWKPTSSQIYTFDAEFLDIMRMYEHYMNGLQSICSEEIKFDFVKQHNIINEDELERIELNIGLNKKTYKCTFDANYNWLNLEVLNFVNGILKSEGIKSKFYGVYNGQGMSMFYCTDEWARKFEEATGITPVWQR